MATQIILSIGMLAGAIAIYILYKIVFRIEKKVFNDEKITESNRTRINELTKEYIKVCERLFAIEMPCKYKAGQEIKGYLILSTNVVARTDSNFKNEKRVWFEWEINVFCKDRFDGFKASQQHLDKLIELKQTPIETPAAK